MEYGSYDKSTGKDADMKRRKAFEADSSDEEAEEKPKRLSTLESFFENREKDAEKKKDRQEKDTKPPEKVLTKSETQEAVQKISVEAKPEVQQKLNQTEQNSAEELEAATVLELYNQLEGIEVEEGQQIEEVIDKAGDKALSELELPDKTEDIEDNPNMLVSTSATTTARNTTIPPTPPTTGSNTTGGNNFPPPPFPRPTAVNGNNQPPPPTNRALTGMPPLPQFGAPNPNAISMPPTQQTAEKDSYYNRGDRRRDLLVGGLVGYFIGRHRGRIKTEERLLPIQQKLEKEVRGLHEAITRKEAEVRAIAAKKFEAASTAETLSRHEKIERLKSQPLPTTRFENPELLISNKQKVPERIASFVIEKSTKPETAPLRNIEQMSIPELLEVAEQVRVENVSLRTMYERGILDQNSLRQAIKEHLRGNRIERLMPELLIGNERRQEMQVEGQPQGQSSSSTSQSQGGMHPVYSNKINQTPSSHFNNPSQPTLFPTYSPHTLPKNQQAKTVWITLAVITSAAILFLLLI